MSIEIAPFAVTAALGQGSNLYPLARNNKRWMRGSYYEGASSRYGQSKAKAIYNVGRLARLQAAGGDVHPFVISDSRQIGAVGVGTVILNQAVKHPQVSEAVAGADVDFWLDKDYDGETAQGEVALALVSRAAILLATSEGTPVNMFAAIVANADHQPTGLTQFMKPIGEPDRLEVPNGPGYENYSDTYDVAKSDFVVQLYAATNPTRG